MHPTGIEPVTTPWKGAILPLNYECVLGEAIFTIEPKMIFPDVKRIVITIF